jgi:hypothetical protein
MRNELFENCGGLIAEISLMKGNVKQGEIISTEIISIPSLKQLVKDEKVDRHIDIDEVKHTYLGAVRCAL